MCRALKVLCAAAGRERLLELKRATVSAHWELVGGASSLDGLVSQVDGSAPDVVVIDVGLSQDAALRVRERKPTVRIVSVGGSLDGADGSAGIENVRDVILGVPPVGGPVGRRGG